MAMQEQVEDCRPLYVGRNALDGSWGASLRARSGTAELKAMSRQQAPPPMWLRDPQDGSDSK